MALGMPTFYITLLPELTMLNAYPFFPPQIMERSTGLQVVEKPYHLQNSLKGIPSQIVQC